MKTPGQFRLALALLTITSLSLGVAKGDAPTKFPADSPAFKVKFPDGWECKPDKEGNLDCDPGDDSGYAYSIVILKDITTRKEMRAILPKLAQAMADSAKIKKFELGDIETDDNDNGVTFTGIRGDGTVEGVPFMVMVHAFEPQKGKFYAIVTAGSKEADTRQEKDYDRITASIDPIEE